MLKLHTLRCKSCNYKRFLDDELLEKFAAIQENPPRKIYRNLSSIFVEAIQMYRMSI